jgi:hypothetical protein
MSGAPNPQAEPEVERTKRRCFAAMRKKPRVFALHDSRLLLAHSHL